MPVIIDMEKTRPVTSEQMKKILPIEELAERIALAKSEGQTVVHCHGVFDLLHIGHIRHFQEAKTHGDLLVVTITPDRFVRKGPHRPAFTEHLRAEALAALHFVDFVAINRWPTAVETIRLLRPDCYVKGPDYKNREEDKTGGIFAEEQAITSVGGRLFFTDDITYSSSHLIHRNLPVFSDEVRAYLLEFAERHTAGDVLEYLEKAGNLRVLVIGEAIIDEYEYCRAIGKSSKEPTLVVQHESLERFAGGTLAVANHVANFAGTTGLSTVLGGEAEYQSFVRQKLDSRIASNFLIRPQAPTIVKKRFVESYFFSKLLEVYKMDADPLTPEENKALLAELDELVPNFDAVIVVDYGHGMLTQPAIELITAKAKFLAVNAQSNAGNLGYHTISKYPRADFVCITENELRLEMRDRHGDLQALIKAVARRYGYERMVVTRGKFGCLAFTPQQGFVQAPALAGQVIDRVGAGDAFLALTAICAAQQAPPDIIGFVGNLAGSQAVATVCNRQPVDRVTLIRQIETLMK